MLKRHLLKFSLLLLLLAGIGASLGCDAAVRGGAEVWIENVKVGDLTQNGNPIEGIPTSNLSAVLKVATNKVYINVDDQGGCTIRLSPSDAVITTGPKGINITGVDPEKIELKLSTPKSTK